MSQAILVLMLLISGCGYIDKQQPEDDEPTSNEEMYLQYLEYLDEANNNWELGWPDVHDCDGLVWSGVACAAGIKVDLEPAFHEGRFERRPYKSCYPDDLDGNGQPDSRSTISNDGMVAAMLCIETQQRIDMAQEMADYGEKNGFIYGEPFPDRIAEVFLKPHFQGLLGRIARQNRSYSKIPLALFYSAEDYVAHIQTLAILAETKVSGGVSSENLALLEKYLQRDPDDYLIRSVLGVYNGEIKKPFTTIDPPSYVRGGNEQRFAIAHWMLAARLHLDL